MPDTIVPDTKDWTWVLREPCPECGYDATTVARGDLGPTIRANAETWARVLAAPGAASRPDAGVWSPLEYACHVRDSHQVFARRLTSMLEHDAPHFANWDQDATALESRYAEQDPTAVAVEVAQAAAAVAATYESLAVDADDLWSRAGVRSDGSEFTIDTLARYHLHDIVHHAWDVRDA